MTSTEELMTVEELARWLRKPKSWVYNRLNDLGIPHYKIGNHLRFKRSEVEAWLDGQREAA